MNKLLLALVAPLAIGATPALAGDYSEGLRAGGTITTCQYLEAERFANPEFGVYMLREQFKTMDYNQQNMLVSLWERDENDLCIAVVSK